MRPNNKNSWTRFNGYLYKYWKEQAAIILLGLVIMPLGLLNPYLTKLVIDKAYGARDLKLFFILAAIGGSVFIFTSVINSIVGYLSRRINQQVYFDMTRDLFRHMQSLDLSFFDDRSTGEHIYRISSDVSSVSSFVCNTIPQMITLFPRLAMILAIVFYLNWKLACFAALLVPVSYLQPYFFGKWLREVTKQTILKVQGIFKELEEVFSHMRLIKAFGKEEEEIRKFEESTSQRMRFELKNAKISNVSSFSSAVLNKALNGTIALYGGYLVIKGSMTLGSLTAIMIYLVQLMGLLKSVGNFYETIAVNSVTQKRLGEMLDTRPSIRDRDGAISHVIVNGDIGFKEVTFRYGELAPVLKDLSFVIPSGTKAALVGSSGCGKTTILSLILRLYEQQEGAILVDGIDTRQIRLDSLKSQIGVALQGPLLWNDTIANNILYGRDGATDEDMTRAAKLAEAHDFIMRLPGRYQSKMGELACKISEGQKQRIAVARALIKRPRILILDEAMSSLDSETEDRIIDNIMAEFRDSTVVMVSHRLSTVRKADMVYFLGSGKTIDTGPSDLLMERNPVYRHIFASQVTTDKVLRSV